MDKPETLVLAQTGEKTLDGLIGYSSPGSGVTVFLHRVQPPVEIEVTITPRKSVRELRGEVLEHFYRDAAAHTKEAAMQEALDAFEAIDRRRQ